MIQIILKTDQETDVGLYKEALENKLTKLWSWT